MVCILYRLIHGEIEKYSTQREIVWITSCTTLRSHPTSTSPWKNLPTPGTKPPKHAILLISTFPRQEAHNFLTRYWPPRCSAYPPPLPAALSTSLSRALSAM